MLKANYNCALYKRFRALMAIINKALFKRAAYMREAIARESVGQGVYIKYIINAL